jgi:hypothetical protein
VTPVRLRRPSGASALPRKAASALGDNRALHGVEDQRRGVGL